MRDFNVKGIRVELKQAGYAILMHPNYYSDHMAADFRVVYADPVKLEPYMEEILKKNPRDYAPQSSKRAEARLGFLEAKTRLLEPMPIIDPDQKNPLPMPYVGCHISRQAVKRSMFRRAVEEEVPRIGFVNGITRTIELLAQGAEFIPLEISKQEAFLLQSIVGGRMSEPVTYYTVPASVSRERMLKYWEQRRQQTPTT